MSLETKHIQIEVHVDIHVDNYTKTESGTRGDREEIDEWRKRG